MSVLLRSGVGEAYRLPQPPRARRRRLSQSGICQSEFVKAKSPAAPPNASAHRSASRARETHKEDIRAPIAVWFAIAVLAKPDRLAQAPWPAAPRRRRPPALAAVG